MNSILQLHKIIYFSIIAGCFTNKTVANNDPLKSPVSPADLQLVKNVKNFIANNKHTVSRPKHLSLPKIQKDNLTKHFMQFLAAIPASFLETCELKIIDHIIKNTFKYPLLKIFQIFNQQIENHGALCLILTAAYLPVTFEYLFFETHIIDYQYQKKCLSTYFEQNWQKSFFQEILSSKNSLFLIKSACKNLPIDYLCTICLWLIENNLYINPGTILTDMGEAYEENPRDIVISTFWNKLKEYKLKFSYRPKHCLREAYFQKKMFERCQPIFSKFPEEFLLHSPCFENYFKEALRDPLFKAILTDSYEIMPSLDQNFIEKYPKYFLELLLMKKNKFIIHQRYQTTLRAMIEAFPEIFYRLIFNHRENLSDHALVELINIHPTFFEQLSRNFILNTDNTKKFYTLLWELTANRPTCFIHLVKEKTITIRPSIIKSAFERHPRTSKLLRESSNRPRVYGKWKRKYGDTNMLILIKELSKLNLDPISFD